MEGDQSGHVGCQVGRRDMTVQLYTYFDCSSLLRTPQNLDTLRLDLLEVNQVNKKPNKNEPVQ